MEREPMAATEGGMTGWASRAGWARGMALAIGLALAGTGGAAQADDGSTPFEPARRAAERAQVVPASYGAGCTVPAQARALRDGMLAEVNAMRRGAGLRPLGHDEQLTRAAAVIACDNARRGRMDHVALREGDLATRVRAQGYRFRNAYEALAFGYRAPDRLARAWRQSAYHYPTLMTPSARETGIAVVQTANGTLWWAMISAQPR